jgi:uncharacterized protein
MNNVAKTELHRAVLTRNVDDVISSLEVGGAPDPLDREERTPLFYAAQDDSLEIAKQLIRHGANVNARDKQGETPLHFAARSFSLAVAKELIQNDVDVDAQDMHGNTALSRAVYDSRGRGEMIAMLVSAGSNKNLKNNRGVSPEDLARSISNFDIGSFFD